MCESGRHSTKALEALFFPDKVSLHLLGRFSKLASEVRCLPVAHNPELRRQFSPEEKDLLDGAE